MTRFVHTESEGSSDSLRELIRDGVGLQRQGRLREAEERYAEVLRRSPDHADALHLLGILALQTGRSDEAAAQLERSLALKPGVWLAEFNLGLALARVGRPDQAASHLERAASLQPGAPQVHSALGLLQMGADQPELALQSFNRLVELQPDGPEGHNNRALALRRLGRPDEALAAFERARALRPDDPVLGVNYADTLVDAGRAEEALGHLDRALSLNPDFFEGYTSRAAVLKALGETERALADVAQAARLRPQFAPARHNLGKALHDENRFAEALAEIDAALALRPDDPEAQNSRAVALAELHRSDEALAAFDRALALRPDYAAAHFGRALTLLQQGRFGEGLAEYEWRKRLPTPLGVIGADKPEWTGDDVAGRTVLLHSEQGLGDTIQFCRYAKPLRERGADVILSVQPPLVALLKTMDRSIPVVAEGETTPPFDLHAPLMSLPFAFGTRVESIPAERRYLRADARRKSRWSKRLPPTDRRRIGLLWAGNRENVRLRRRLLPFDAVRPLLSLPAAWVSLQRDVRPEESEALEAAGVPALGDELRDFADTAALIDSLDLVVTVDTAVAHLAGALGKAVWILLAHNPDWRWFLERQDSPWYPDARLFRQPTSGAWAGVVEAVAAALEREFTS